jgi:hypothetical protein
VARGILCTEFPKGVGADKSDVQIFVGDESVQLDDVRKLLEFRGGFVGIQRKAVEAIAV